MTETIVITNHTENSVLDMRLFLLWRSLQSVIWPGHRLQLTL